MIALRRVLLAAFVTPLGVLVLLDSIGTAATALDGPYAAISSTISFPMEAFLDHWWVFPASIVFSIIALASGVSGALFFSPFFLLVVGVPVVSDDVRLVSQPVRRPPLMHGNIPTGSGNDIHEHITVSRASDADTYP